jgi:hypothetical protein
MSENDIDFKDEWISLSCAFLTFFSAYVNNILNYGEDQQLLLELITEYFTAFNYSLHVESVMKVLEKG